VVLGKSWVFFVRNWLTAAGVEEVLLLVLHFLKVPLTGSLVSLQSHYT